MQDSGRMISDTDNELLLLLLLLLFGQIEGDDRVQVFCLNEDLSNNRPVSSISEHRHRQLTLVPEIEFDIFFLIYLY
jgi:hypothetical protein